MTEEILEEIGRLIKQRKNELPRYNSIHHPNKKISKNDFHSILWGILLEKKIEEGQWIEITEKLYEMFFHEKLEGSEAEERKPLFPEHIMDLMMSEAYRLKKDDPQEKDTLNPNIIMPKPKKENEEDKAKQPFPQDKGMLR